ncbi:hypothetical protein D3C78_1680640 [compost metagenome]
MHLLLVYAQHPPSLWTGGAVVSVAGTAPVLAVASVAVTAAISLLLPAAIVIVLQ